VAAVGHADESWCLRRTVGCAIAHSKEGTLSLVRALSCRPVTCLGTRVDSHPGKAVSLHALCSQSGSGQYGCPGVGPVESSTGWGG